MKARGLIKKISRRACLLRSLSGFTLVEIILVVVLISVVAAVAFPDFHKSFAALQVKRTADHLSYLMRYAQSEAMTKQCPFYLVFSEDSSSYWITRGLKVSDGWEGEAFQEEGTELSRERIRNRFGKTFTVPSKVELTSEVQEIEFLPDGRIQKAFVKVCLEDKCSGISTRKYPGRVVLMMENSEDFYGEQDE